MIKITAALAAFAGLTLAIPAQGAETDSASAPEAKEAKAEEKTICRRETFVGSNMPKKTCRTESEWRAVDAVNRRAVTERERER